MELSKAEREELETLRRATGGISPAVVRKALMLQQVWERYGDDMEEWPEYTIQLRLYSQAELDELRNAVFNACPRCGAEVEQQVTFWRCPECLHSAPISA